MLLILGRRISIYGGPDGTGGVSPSSSNQAASGDGADHHPVTMAGVGQVPEKPPRSAIPEVHCEWDTARLPHRLRL